jgi:hypothetical protein
MMAFGTFSNFISRLGNYWSASSGKYEKNEDGIVDRPYVIGNVKDSYPLLEAIESYNLKL